METIYLTEKIGHSTKKISKEEIINMLRNLPKDKPINKKTINEYPRSMICRSDVLVKNFGAIKNACKEAGVRCDCRYAKEVLQALKKDKDIEKKRRQNQIKWNKENIIESLKKLEKKYGKLKAIDISMYSKKGECCSRDVIVKHFGTTIKAFEEAGVKHRNYHWSKGRIIKALQNLYNNHGEFAKKDLRHKFIKEGLICERVHIQKQFGSLEEAAKEAGIKFKPAPNDGTRVGKYEKNILDKIEIENDIKLIRQFPVQCNKRFFIDGYDPINNVAYEVDEEKHRWFQIEDEIRQREIEKELGCTFERIKLF